MEILTCLGLEDRLIYKPMEGMRRMQQIVALDTPAALKRSLPQNGHEPTPEDVFLELTCK